MKKVVFICFLFCFFLGGGISMKGQSPKKFTLPTPWTDKALEVAVPLPEYLFR